MKTHTHSFSRGGGGREREKVLGRGNVEEKLGQVEWGQLLRGLEF